MKIKNIPIVGLTCIMATIITAAVFLFSLTYIDSLDSTAAFTIFFDFCSLCCIIVFLMATVLDIKENIRIRYIFIMLVLIFISGVADILCKTYQEIPNSGDVVLLFHYLNFLCIGICSLVFYMFARKIVYAGQNYGVPLATVWLIIASCIYLFANKYLYYINDNGILVQSAIGVVLFAMYPIIVQQCALYLAFKYELPTKQTIIFVGFNMIPLIISIGFRLLFNTDIMIAGYTMTLLSCYLVFFN